MYWAFGWQIYYAIGDGQWYLFSNRMLQLVRTQITFGIIVLFLRWILSKFVRFLLEAIFWILNFEPDNQKCYFQTKSYIGISSKQCIVYCLTDVFGYVSIYRYIDSPLIYSIRIFIMQMFFFKKMKGVGNFEVTRVFQLWIFQSEGLFWIPGWNPFANVSIWVYWLYTNFNDLFSQFGHNWAYMFTVLGWWPFFVYYSIHMYLPFLTAWS